MINTHNKSIFYVASKLEILNRALKDNFDPNNPRTFLDATDYESKAKISDCNQKIESYQQEKHYNNRRKIIIESKIEDLSIMREKITSVYNEVVHNTDEKNKSHLIDKLHNAKDLLNKLKNKGKEDINIWSQEQEHEIDNLLSKLDKSNLNKLDYVSLKNFAKQFANKMTEIVSDKQILLLNLSNTIEAKNNDLDNRSVLESEEISSMHNSGTEGLQILKQRYEKIAVGRKFLSTLMVSFMRYGL